MKEPKMRGLWILMVCFFIWMAGWIQGKNLPVVNLQEKDVFDFSSRLDENEVFLRNIFGFDYDGHHVYYLDNHFCTIFKVELESFKLVKTISSKGQGPGELSIVIGLSCKNGKLYVADVGFGGIKIFDTEGKFLKQFKVIGLSFGFGMITKYIIDVSDDEEIYVRCNVIGNGTLISVYDKNGRRLRGLIPAEGNSEKVYLSSLMKNQLIFTLDNSGHIIVLFTKLGKLQKYDKQGKLLWSRDILKELPKKERNEEKFKKLKGGIRGAVNFLGLAVLEDNRIFASGVFTGVLLSEKGTVIGLFKSPEGKGGFGYLLFWKGSRLIGMEKQYDFHRYIKFKKSKNKPGLLADR
jgi:hypothetical protein